MCIRDRKYEIFQEKELTNYLFYKFHNQEIKIANESEEDQKRLLKDGLDTYLVKHILCDLEVMKNLTGNNVDIEKLFGILVIELINKIDNHNVENFKKMNASKFILFLIIFSPSWFKTSKKSF